jgi:hypothetical protein
VTMRPKVIWVLFVAVLALEIVFLLSTLSVFRPRSSSAIEALFAYRNHPSLETQQRWEQELAKMNREVRLKKTVGYALSAANGIFLVYLGTKLRKT